MISIQEASDLLIKQTMFSKYFLKILGQNVKDNVENIKHTQLFPMKPFF